MLFMLKKLLNLALLNKINIMKTTKWWLKKNQLIIKLEKEIELKSKDIWFTVSEEYYYLKMQIYNEYKKIN